MQTVDFWIEHLKLQPHPEGGFYKETYRATETIDRQSLPKRFPGDRNFSTSIYFLLRSQDRSVFHRIKSDELWHYHAGSSLTLFVLNEDGLKTHLLGSGVDRGESLQVVIPANSWFGARVNEMNSYVLSGCTVSPGFDFADFEMAQQDALLAKFPAHADIVKMLT